MRGIAPSWGGESGGEKREGGEMDWVVGLQIFLNPTQPIDRSMGLKVGPDSDLRPNFYGPNDPARQTPSWKGEIRLKGKILK